jgi:putative membrane protein
MSRGAKTALIIGGVVLLVLAALPAILGAVNPSGYRTWGWGRMGPGMIYGFGGAWFMGILMIIFWGLIIWGIIALVRYFGGNRQAMLHSDSAMEILKRRYASGEITREEFEEKKKTLN